MRGGQAQEGEHFVLELLEMRQTSPDDDSAERVSDEADPSEAGEGQVVLDEGGDFRGEALAHVRNVALRVVLVDGGAEEHGFGVQVVEVVLEQLHVVGVALEAVHEDEEVNALVVGDFVLGEDQVQVELKYNERCSRRSCPPAGACRFPRRGWAGCRASGTC